MSFEADLKAHLQGASAVSALVADRIYPVVVKEGAAMPAISYLLPFGAPENCLDGFTSGLASYSVQIDCWANTHDEATRLAAAVRDRMSTAASTFAGVVNQFPLLDDYESDTKRYRRSIGWSGKHKEYV